MYFIELHWKILLSKLKIIIKISLFILTSSCFSSDPPPDHWQSCGQLHAQEEEGFSQISPSSRHRYARGRKLTNHDTIYVP